MTDGEKMIWAAEFVRSYGAVADDIRKVHGAVSGDETSEHWAAAYAAESATTMVERLRLAAPKIESWYRRDSVHDMTQEMLK